MAKYSLGAMKEIKVASRQGQVLLLSLFILVDTGQAFVSDWAERRSAAGEKLPRKRRCAVKVALLWMHRYPYPTISHGGTN